MPSVQQSGRGARPRRPRPRKSPRKHAIAEREATRGSLAARITAERGAGLRFVIETTRPSTSREVESAVHNLGIRGRIVPLVPEQSQAGARLRHRLFLVVEPDRATADVAVSPFDLAHHLREASAGAFARVEPDLPQQFPEADDDRAVRAGLSGWCWEPGAPPEGRYWHLRVARVDAAWAYAAPTAAGSRGEGIRIGHPDTGWTGHEELRGALDVESGWDFVDDDPDSIDPISSGSYPGQPGHGTKTGTVIASRFHDPLPPPDAGSVTELAGVAPRATLVPIRCIRSVVIFYNADVARAIDHAVRVGCHVISLSFGGIGGRALEEAVQRAVAANVIVCAAAGNCAPWVVEPAAYESCIAVGGTNPNGRPWKGSGSGRSVTVCAPATHVWTADPTNLPAGVTTGQGTSFAVAMVAGIAALWLGRHGRDALLERYRGGRLPLQSVFAHLLRSTASTPRRWDPAKYGAGIVDAEALLKAELPGARVVRGAAKATASRARAEDRITSMLESLDLPRASLRAWREVLPAALPARGRAAAETKLLEMEMALIFQHHGNVYRAIGNSMRAAAGRPRGSRGRRLDWRELEGLAKHGSDRLREHLSRLHQ